MKVLLVTTLLLCLVASEAHEGNTTRHCAEEGLKKCLQRKYGHLADHLHLPHDSEDSEDSSDLDSPSPGYDSEDVVASPAYGDSVDEVSTDESDDVADDGSDAITNDDSELPKDSADAEEDVSEEESNSLSTEPSPITPTSEPVDENNGDDEDEENETTSDESIPPQDTTGQSEEEDGSVPSSTEPSPTTPEPINEGNGDDDGDEDEDENDTTPDGSVPPEEEGDLVPTSTEPSPTVSEPVDDEESESTPDGSVPPKEDEEAVPTSTEPSPTVSEPEDEEENDTTTDESVPPEDASNEPVETAKPDETSPAPEPTDAFGCTGKRVRKSWEALDENEKATYLGAVQKAMERGYHEKFTKLHKEYLAESEAHRTCGFIYWHRMYLLGYENMLRSMGEKYKCLTIPYWDHLAASARFAHGECRSIEDCAPIVQDFGGTRVGKSVSFTVDGTTLPARREYTCITEGVAGHVCGSENECVNCIPRGNAHRKRYPASAFLSSVYEQVFSSDDHVEFTSAVEQGMHNVMHSVMDGAMAYLIAPIDPLFYAHHGITDLLQTIYLKCQNGGEKIMTLKEKQTDTRFWRDCSRRTSGQFQATDRITMGEQGGRNEYIHVIDDATHELHEFFKGLPRTYAEYVDAKDLGDYSYVYEMSGGLALMYSKCKDALSNSGTVDLAADMQEVQLSQYESGVSLLPIVKNERSDAEEVMARWTMALNAVSKLTGFNDKAAGEQMEMMTCAYKEMCLGGLEDYSETFRANFKPKGHTRCISLRKQAYNGDKICGVPHFHSKITEKFYSCQSFADYE